MKTLGEGHGGLENLMKRKILDELCIESEQSLGR